MSRDDQSDVWRELRAMKKKIARLESGTMLENASITRGRVRFIGGTLRLDSGARLELVGTMDAEGTINVTGLLNGDGQLVWSGSVEFTGPWTFTGDGAIAGDVEVTGDVNVRGGGRIVIEGASEDAILTDGQLRYGDAYISGQSDGIAMLVPAAGGTANQVIVSPTHVQLGYKGQYVVVLSDSGILVQGLEAGPVVNYIGQDANGYLKAATGGTGGGPGDGVFAWPFSLDLVTSEYGMRVNPVTGEYTLHEGIDFGSGIANIQGTPIPAAGSGTVEVAGIYGGYGNAVIINHGIDPVYDGGGHLIQTLYGHMYQAPDVSVGQGVMLGDTLGGIGQTGQSFGNHLHFEVWVDGVKVNPRTFMAQHGG